MEKDKHIYKVAEHQFEVRLNNVSFLAERMQESYAPFEVGEDNEKKLFTVSVVDDVKNDDITTCIFAEEQTNIDTGCHKVFVTTEGWLFEQTQPFSVNTNGRVRMDSDFCHAQIAVRGNEQQRWFAFNNALQICYLLATAQYDTLLTHSSCVVNDGKAYLFLGKSGTGKSTHSSLWLKYITGTTLLNDDHPVIRVNRQGEIIAYGSPWSGKTPCYHNESAPVGGIVRIKRANHNSIVKLGDVQAYVSLTTSSSGMTWEKPLADGRHRTIAKVIKNVPCYMLSCLPDEKAARVCHSKVTNQFQENNNQGEELQ